MVKKEKVLAIIPARGGSKRLPYKNILPLGGKPLIAWTIEAAVQSGVADEVIVSSDDERILQIATQYGAIAFPRSSELASDTASTIDVVRDVLEHEESKCISYGSVILLQPTSPLRSAKDIVAAYEIFVDNNKSTVVSVCEVEHPVEWCGLVSDGGEFVGGDFKEGKRSQDYAKRYRLNGAIYISSRESIILCNSFYSEKVFAFHMARDNSVDIDTALDFFVCKALIEA